MLWAKLTSAINDMFSLNRVDIINFLPLAPRRSEKERERERDETDE